MTAAEAERAGLVSRVVPEDQLLPEAYKLAAKIGSLSTIAIAKAKDCVHRAYETSLGEGLRYEQCVLLLYLAILWFTCLLHSAAYQTNDWSGSS